MIRISIIPQGNAEAYKTRLLEAMKGSKIQYTGMVDKILQQVSPMEFAQLVQNGQVEEILQRFRFNSIDIDSAGGIAAVPDDLLVTGRFNSIDKNGCPLTENIEHFKFDSGLEGYVIFDNGNRIERIGVVLM